VFIDQAQSMSHYYKQDTSSAKQVIQDIIDAWEKGCKTLYYATPEKAEMEVCESCGS